MRIGLGLGVAVGAFCVFLCPQLLAAEQCGLKRYVSLDMHEDADDQILVEITIAHTPRLMIVDTGGATSALSEDVVNELKLPKKQIAGIYFYGGDGSKMTNFVDADLDIGAMHASKWSFLVMRPHPSWAARHVAGLLGPDILGKFDLDFDFAANKLNLFSPDHCEGQVVYWTNAFSVIPFELSEEGHIDISLSLDGKDTRGIVDTGANVTTMLAPQAHQLFGIDQSSPGVEGNETSGYHIQFHSLTIAGVTVQNPVIHLLPNSANLAYIRDMGLSLHQTGAQTRLGNQMLLGTNVLRHLHAYVAYREHKIYVTAADAH